MFYLPGWWVAIAAYVCGGWFDMYIGLLEEMENHQELAHA
jgi:hypothetical protein